MTREGLEEALEELKRALMPETGVAKRDDEEPQGAAAERVPRVDKDTGKSTEWWASLEAKHEALQQHGGGTGGTGGAGAGTASPVVAAAAAAGGGGKAGSSSTQDEA